MSTGTDVLEQLGIRIASEGEREITAHCPFHADSHPSFSMNATSHLWICFQCGESGTLEILVSKVGGNVDNTAQLLREVRSSAIKEKAKPEPVEPKTVIEEIDPIKLSVIYEDYGNPPNWAQEERLLSPATTKRYGVKWDTGWIIPIWDPNDWSLMGWQFKRLDFVSNYPKTVKKSQTLFGLKELDFTTVVIVESPLDVVRLASVGVSAVSSYGAFVSKVQLDLLIDVADKIVLALDNDAAGIPQTAKIYPYLAKRLPTLCITYPPNTKDPGDFTDRQVEKVFGGIQRNASPISARRGRDDARQSTPLARPRPRAREDRLLNSRH